MQFPSVTIVLFIAVSLVLVAGCTQGTGPAQPVTPVPATPHLADLTLNASELPPCFSVTSGETKTASEVGPLARDLGWESGYVATYTCPGEGSEPTILVHSLAVYPADNVPGIASMVDKQDRMAGFTYQDFGDPDQRAFIHGYYGTFNVTGTNATSPGAYVVSGGREEPVAITASDNAIAEFIVYRKNVFEVLKMTGPGTNATVIHELARTAAMKIP